MDFARINKDKIIKLYIDEGKSSYEIAEELGTYSTKVLRALDFLGIEKRTYSEAQAVAIENGRSKHPTRGKKLNKEHKTKIGDSRSRAYHMLSDEEKQKISEMGKKSWDDLGKAKQEEIRQLALEGVRQASKIGSKTERFIRNSLSQIGYFVEFHKSGLIYGSTLEVDLFLPEIRTAIEIDGPGHFLPIWGDEKLKKQQSSDLAKQGILINGGYRIIRIRQLDKNISLTRMNQLLELVVYEIEKIKNKQGKVKQLIEIEVKDGRSSII